MSGQQQPDQKKRPEMEKAQGKYHSILKYSGLAFQMIAVVLIFTFLGYKLDQYFGLSVPIFMIVFIIAGLGAYLYKLIKSL